jgi:serine phosphatase RsbU (regulator of sigma subunit)
LSNQKIPDTDITKEEQIAYIDAINAKVWLMRGSGYEPDFDPMKAVENIRELSSIIGYEDGLARSTLSLGMGYYIIEHNIPLALEYITKALALFRKADNKKWIANGLLTHAIIQNTAGSKEEALYHALRGIPFYDDEKEWDSDAVMGFYVTGTIYKDLGKLEEAERYYLRGTPIQTPQSDMWKGRIYSALSGIYTMQEKYEPAIENADRGLKLLRESNNTIAESRALTEIALIYKKQKKYPEALDYFFQGLGIREKLPMRQFEMVSLIEIGSLYCETGEDTKAIEYLRRAETIATEIKHEPQLAKICRDLGNAYKKLSNHKQALDYYEKFMQVRMKLNNEETERKIADAQTSALKEKEEEIERLRNVELKHAYEIISKKNKEVTDSINYAKRIQQSILPPDSLLHQYLDNYFLLFKPKDIVSGDFYWALHKTVTGPDRQERELFYVAVADSTGHGVPGAFMSLLNITFLNEAVNEKNITEPNAIFDHVRKRLIETISGDGGQDGMDGILVCVDCASGKISYASANNAPVLINGSGITHLPADKMPVGKGERTEGFKLYSADTKKGDMLYLYTDGYADQFGGPKGKKFKYRQLDELLQSNHQLPLKEQSGILNQTFENWKGRLEQIDDVCIIGIRL